MAGAAVTVGALVLPVVDLAPLRARATVMGLATPLPYLAGAAAWSLLNSFVEELVYRWFILRQCEALLAPRPAAVLQAAIFTVHHAVALSTYLPLLWTGVASAAVLLAGVVWALLFQRYRSLWPPWLSHALADLAVFALGWRMLFGGG